jgi:thiazole synthase ThiGH ThiG subunit
MARAHVASGAEMVTVAVRRANLTDRSKYFILPNTAGLHSRRRHLHRTLSA